MKKGKKMKKLLLPTICILLSVLVIAAVPTESDAAIYESTVRLHILAPSDSSEDQALKLAVRDEILKRYSYALEASDAADAEEKIRAALPDIRALAADIAADAGYTATAEIVREWYDTRTYGDTTLPCGTYTSLRITLGTGEGQNWWCVMYPPLCLDIATEDARADSTADIVSPSGYRVRFKLLEVAAILLEKEK